MDNHRLAAEAAEIGLILTSDQLNAFQDFEEVLYSANVTMNLTRVPREECRLRHFADSLLFQRLVPQGARVLDIGTGPGFPAWPLACARPDLDITALDSNGKMLGFLSQHLLPNLKTVLARAEEWHAAKPFDIVTGRAVAPLSAQLEISARHCRKGGLVIPMRTPAERPEFDRADLVPLGLRLVNVEEIKTPGVEIVRLFPVYEKVKPTRAGFPRPWSTIKSKPL